MFFLVLFYLCSNKPIYLTQSTRKVVDFNSHSFEILECRISSSFFFNLFHKQSGGAISIKCASISSFTCIFSVFQNCFSSLSGALNILETNCSLSKICGINCSSSTDDMFATIVANYHFEFNSSTLIYCSNYQGFSKNELTYPTSNVVRVQSTSFHCSSVNSSSNYVDYLSCSFSVEGEDISLSYFICSNSMTKQHQTGSTCFHFSTQTSENLQFLLTHSVFISNDSGFVVSSPDYPYKFIVISYSYFSRNSVLSVFNFIHDFKIQL